VFFDELLQMRQKECVERKHVRNIRLSAQGSGILWLGSRVLVLYALVSVRRSAKSPVVGVVPASAVGKRRDT
jgi:hypothetical protein